MAGHVDSVVPLDRATRLYGHKITKAWQSSVEAIFEVGRLLIEAKADLQHGEFEQMVKQSCPFGARTARRLIGIANHETLSNRTHVSVLPNHWGTLAELARFEPAELSHAIGNHWVKPDMTREDVKYLHARTQKALGTRSRMPPKLNLSKPPTFAVRLRNVMEEDVLEWLGNVDEKTAGVVAERVAQLILDLRREMTDGQ